MLSALREDDALGRYGGEEFLAVLGPCDGLASAAAVAQRVRLRLWESPMPTAGGPVVVTASLRVAYAGFGAAAQTADALVRAADEAVYRAKHAGRNRVELAPPLPVNSGCTRAG